MEGGIHFVDKTIAIKSDGGHYIPSCHDPLYALLNLGRFLVWLQEQEVMSNTTYCHAAGYSQRQGQRNKFRHTNSQLQQST